MPDEPRLGPSVVDLVDDHLSDESPGPSATAAIHGSIEPDEISRQIEGVLPAIGFSQPIVKCLFHVASVGSVTGVVLADGDRLVIKAYQPAWRLDFLQGVVATQDKLWHAGLPCGRPVGGPVPCGHGLATVETFVPDPGQPDAFGDDERTASAEGLARVVASAGLDHRLALHPLLAPVDGLYPTPHSPLFDFDATSEGAEWIDDLARLACAAKQEVPTVGAHTDWSARNVRLRADGVHALYDIDSMASVSLPTAVGEAAVNWRALGEVGEPTAPGIDEIDDYVDRFPIPLSKAERRAALAASLWSLCYTARCEHAVDPGEQHNLRARPRLRDDAGRFRRALTG